MKDTKDMNKSITHFFECIPDIIHNMICWSKEVINDNAKTIVENTGGSIGLILKIFTRPIIDKYEKNQTRKKLENYGSNTYLTASYKQAQSSLNKISDEIPPTTPEILSVLINQALDDSKPDGNIYPVFQPLYHPLVVSVKQLYCNILKSIHTPSEIIDRFIKDFNENIENSIEIEFGNDYSKHKQDIIECHYEKNELKLLFDTIQLSKIGFEKNEDLKYETTYAEWKRVSEFEDFKIANEYIDTEETLVPITQLIEEYFPDSMDNVNKILFIIADFGKGKSVFMKQYASSLAKQYLSTKEGYFPIYFNLRNYNKTNQETKLGVINDFLLGEYGINIESGYFKNKKYCFLMDSLDESGDLNHYYIDKVISSLKKIQNLDKTQCRSNRLIVTSRPFDNGLKEHLVNHFPFCIKNEENREIECYISLYGFKKEQFNDWIFTALKQAKRKIFDTDVDFVNKIYHAIDENKSIDIYKTLLSHKTLTSSELRRPIFAYMIYQLIMNNIDILKIGKIGIYLSFLNLLTKDAKHIKDPTYKVSLKEEFEYRNLLHATAALWMFQRHTGKQGFLSKADLCRVLEGKNTYESDQKIITRYQNKGVIEIEFLSHSYFGECNNTLHFQHQSFAEILLAEYYLKIFLRYALDEQLNIDEVKSKLLLGIPTEQTIIFLIDLLHLLLRTSRRSVSKETIEQRKLLFPLCASLSVKKNNNLFCNELYYEWYKKGKFVENATEYPEELIKEWCIKEEHIKKILELCKQILLSERATIVSQAESRTSLFNEEALLLKSSLDYENINIDKWLALLVGNTLCNNTNNSEAPILFNTQYHIPYTLLFNMLCTELCHKTMIFDNWKRNLFKGIDMRNLPEQPSKRIHNYVIRLFSILNHIDFSYSYLSNVDFSGCLLGHTNFSYCTFKHVDFSHCYIWEPMFKNIQELDCNFKYCLVSNSLIENLIYKPTARFHIHIPKSAETEDQDLLVLIQQFHQYYKHKNIDYANWIIPKLKFSSTKQKKLFLEILAQKLSE